MAKKGQSVSRKRLNKLAQAVAGTAPQAPIQDVAPQATTVAPIRGKVMIPYVGQKQTDGTWKNYGEKDAAEVGIVSAELLTRYSQDRKHVIVDMAYNFLAHGAKLPEHLLNLATPFWAERSMKEHKRQWKYLLENANAEVAREAWRIEVNNRSRIDEVTIQALAKAVRHLKAGGQTDRVSPVGKLARDVLAIVGNRSLTLERIVTDIRKLCESKAEYKDQPAKAAAVA